MGRRCGIVEAVTALALSVVIPAGLPAMAAAAATASPALPVVSGIAPSHGPTSGGTVVTVTGTGLQGTLGVAFGAAAAASFHVASDTELSAVSPPGQGVVDVMVITQEGVSTPGGADRFAYGSAEPPAETTLAAAAGAAESSPVTLHLTLGSQGTASSPLPTPWCRLSVVGDRPVAPLMCALGAFVPATALWNEATRTATVYVGAAILQVTIGAASATLTTPSGRREVAVDPPARLDPPGVTIVPLALLASLLGGREQWDAEHGTALLSAAPFDPGLAQARAVLTLLPPYPGGAPTEEQFTRGAPVTSMAVHERDASRQWLVPASLSAVEAWLTTEATRSGLSNQMRGELGCTPSRPNCASVGEKLPQYWFVFGPLEVTLHPVSATATLVRYDGLESEPGTRPAPERVPPGAVEVTVTRESPSGALGTSTVLTDPTVIAHLIAVADSLPLATVLVNPGGPALTSTSLTGIRFDFSYGPQGGSPGSTAVLTEGVVDLTGDVSVRIDGMRYPALYDGTHALLAAAGVSRP